MQYKLFDTENNIDIIVVTDLLIRNAFINWDYFVIICCLWLEIY
jgi:hypothetical protein